MPPFRPRPPALLIGGVIESRTSVEHRELHRVVTDQHAAERWLWQRQRLLSQASAGENAADRRLKPAGEGSMKTAAGVDERTLPYVEPPSRSKRRFDSAPRTCSVQGGRIESRRRPTGSYQVVQNLFDLHGILDHCDHP